MATHEDLDHLFDDSAERRLVEHQRAALGHAPRERVRRAVEGTSPDEAVAPRDGAALAIEVRARPDRDVIPGAVVTVAVRVTNDGGRPSGEVTVRTTLPAGAREREESLRVDGVPATANDDGWIAVGTLAPRERRSITWQLVVEPGLEPLFLGIEAASPGAGVVGAPSFVVRRRRARAVAEAARPFYELDEQEEHVEAEPLDDDALQPETMRVAPPAPEPEAVVAASPRVVPEPVAVTAPATAPRFITAISAAQLRVVGALFAPDVAPLALAHHLLVELVAARRSPDGSDPSGLDALLVRDIAGLTRALVSARTGRPASAPTVNAVELAALHFRTGDDGPLPGTPGSVTLATPIDDALIAALRATAAAAVPPLLRLRQLAIRLAARETLPRDAAAGAALAAYNAAAAAWVARLVVRSAVDRRLDVLGPAPVALHDAGRDLVRRLTVMIA